MKTNLNTCFRMLLMAGVLITPPLALSACADDEIQRPEVTEPLMPELGPEGTDGIQLSQIETYIAFESGVEAHSTRIPAIVTGSDGSLIVFCEGRHKIWKDTSYSDVMMKRSTDNGATWSNVVNLTGVVNPGEQYAFMDPTPVVDQATGKVFVFCTRHDVGTTGPTNRAMLIVSNDNGVTWETPKDVTEMLGGSGFGPSSGIQIRQGKFAGRMLLNSRQATGGVIIYSDDHGTTWKHTNGCAMATSEATIAESGKDKLLINIRKGTNRYSATSTDGGMSWTTAEFDNGLPVFESGCHACVFGLGNNMVIYCGPQGGPKSDTYDNRYDLMLYRSPLTGVKGTWSRKQQLTNLAAGYPSMTTLKDGRLVIAYEAGPEHGFIRTSAPRPKGWMRIDILVLPKEVLSYDYWFDKEN